MTDVLKKVFQTPAFDPDVAQCAAFQLNETCCFKGVGLHSGQPAQLRLSPGSQGWRLFVNGNSLAPGVQNVTSTRFCTTLGQAQAAVMTVEHLFSALYGMGLWDVDIHLEGSEVPILDGSALPFVQTLLQKGSYPAPMAPPSPLTLTQPIKIQAEHCWALIEPSDHLEISYRIDYPLWGEQVFNYRHSPQRYVQEIAPARTFAFEHDLPLLREQGLIQGGTLENALVFDAQGAPLNHLRFENEPLRHKILDLLGDLALLGQPLQARLTIYRGGHALHVKMVEQLTPLQRKP